MDQLKQELNELKLNDKNEEVSLEFDPIELLKQVEYLKKQVTNLQLEQIGAKQSVGKLEGSTKKQLLVDHLNDLKKSLNKADVEAKSHEQSVEKSMIFKIFNDLDSSELNKASKVTFVTFRVLET
jgi:septum formation inhibitor MinC